jgi:hypothetical protein
MVVDLLLGVMKLISLQLLMYVLYLQDINKLCINVKHVVLHKCTHDDCIS